jgi:hypothetical protein
MSKPQWAVNQGRRALEKRKLESAAMTARKEGRTIGCLEGATRERVRWTEHLQMVENNDYYLQRVERPRVIVMDRPKHQTFRAFNARELYVHGFEKHLFIAYPMVIDLPHGTRVYWLKWEYAGPD